MALGKLAHYACLEQAIVSVFGDNVRLSGAKPVLGGDINQAYRLALTDGSLVFLKANQKGRAAFFKAEAAGLFAIARAKAIGTPKPLCTGEDCGELGGAFLLLEYLREERRTEDYWEVFGRQLADMHKAGTEGLVEGGQFGFFQDNYIGANKQRNTAHAGWVSFFRDCRLRPQLAQAGRYFDSQDRKRIGRLLERLPDILSEPERPSLLHGDLWSGNFMTGADGKAWLIDPAAYVGHAEADLAMTELFGGFPQRFYDSYREAMPLQPGYERRRDLYNLYHLLNHLNLFGGTYLHAAREAIGKYGR